MLLISFILIKLKNKIQKKSKVRWKCNTRKISGKQRHRKQSITDTR